ncbi:MAG: transposase [Bacteroidota bacterium]
MLNSLLDEIKVEFSNYRRSCIKNVLILALCLLRKETVCFHRLKSEVGLITGVDSTQPASHYKRLIRIFDFYAFSSLWLDLLKYVLILLRLKSEYLLLDGSSWKQGEYWHHYLTLCVVYRQVAIPIYWLNLNKQGTSNFSERKKLLKKAARHFHLSDKVLLADREYIGTKWFKLLKSSNIPFVIRLRKKTYQAAIDQAPGRSYEQIKGKVRRSKVPYKTLRKDFCLEGMDLALVVVKNPKPQADEPLIYLITDLKESALRTALRYPIRWKIEHCFKHLKSNGFDLEAINLKGEARRTLLMAVVVFSYVLSIHQGLKTYHKVPSRTFTNQQTYKVESVFRYGINQIAQCCRDWETFLRFLIDQIRLATKQYRSPDSIIV